VLDLPGSARIGREILAEAGMNDRVAHREGNALTADLGHDYDVVLCFNLVHHLGPDDIVGLFTRVRAALAPGGSIAVMDSFVEADRRPSAASSFLGLFVYLSSGAQSFTGAQLREWLDAAGFAAPRRVAIRRIPGQALYQAAARRL
jgi:cyclopropane fatty-acyl-phospholipid synthase-like methyltransferase